MKTVLAVIAFFFIAAAQARVATAATEAALSGLPMHLAKRLDLRPEPADAHADSKLSDTPMSQAKLLVEPARVAPQAQGGAANAQPRGVPMVHAKRR